MVSSFKYLVWVFMVADYGWAVVISNIRNLRKQWARMSHILWREGENARVSKRFYKSVVQDVLIYGSEMWFLMPQMVRTLFAFRHRVARNLIG